MIQKGVVGVKRAQLLIFRTVILLLRPALLWWKALPSWSVSRNQATTSSPNVEWTSPVKGS